MILYVILFLFWLLILYTMHVIAHKVPFFMKFHHDHHHRIYTGNFDGKFKWYHLFLWIDSWESTIDQWLLEVIPTILYCWIFGCWWILLFYWIYSAIIEESIEHNTKFDYYPFLTSGKWHLIHHSNPNKNYGLIFPIWNKIFQTEKNP